MGSAHRCKTPSDVCSMFFIGKDRVTSIIFGRSVVAVFAMTRDYEARPQTRVDGCDAPRKSKFSVCAAAYPCHAVSGTGMLWSPS